MVIFIASIEKVSRSFERAGGPEDSLCAISIIMPVYNTEAYLKDCLDSILHQSFRDMELICVDDESTDHSLAVLREYESADPRVRVIAMPHGGQSAARNRGLSEARGKYVYFMDSDDKLADNALETMYALMEERNVDVLYFDGEAFFDTPELAETYRRFNHRNRRAISYSEVVPGVKLFARMFGDKAYRVSPCLQILRSDFIRAAGLRFYEGIIYEDNLFTLQAILQAERVSHENAVLFFRRVRNGSTLTSAKEYRNFYGYFICWNEMTAFVQSRHIRGPMRKALNRHLHAIRIRAIDDGAALPDAEISANIEKEPLHLRWVYRVAFRAELAWRRRENAGARKSRLSRAMRRIASGVADRIGGALIFFFDGRRPGRP